MCEKPMPAALGPVEHGGDQRAGLRDEGDVAGQRVGVREAGVEADVRASAAPMQFGPEHAQQVRPRRVERRPASARRSSPAVMTITARVPSAPSSADQPGDGRGGVHRTARSGAVGRSAVRANTGYAVERRVLRIHGIDRAREAAGAQVAPDRRADAAGSVRGADDGDRRRLEQAVEIADAHGRWPTPFASPSAIAWHPTQRRATGRATTRRGSMGSPQSMQMP